ncbi:MAG: type II secretion system GspH family protein [Nitrospira sp.]|nr:type II secretion system GspH family protein [Nitrospira sp.]
MAISYRQQIINERGVTYLMLMFAIVLIGIATTAAAKQWKTTVQRELEIDLLAKGIEIQNALALYSATKKAGRVMPGEMYPQTLADLTRLPKPFLRKVYLDPMEHGEWEYVRAPTGGIMGVRSKSRAKPFRQRNFPLAVRHFEGRPTYRDWIFQHPSPSSAPIVPQGTVPSSPSSAPIVPQGTVPSPPEPPPMEEFPFVPDGGAIDGSASMDPPIAGEQTTSP